MCPLKLSPPPHKGLELNLQTLPPSLSWLPRLSFCSYAFEVLLTTELDGTTVLVEIPGAPPVRLGAQARSFNPEPEPDPFVVWAKARNLNFKTKPEPSVFGAKARPGHMPWRPHTVSVTRAFSPTRIARRTKFGHGQGWLVGQAAARAQAPPDPPPPNPPPTTR